MNCKFEEMFISDILKLYPETISVFLANGFQDFSDKDIIDKIGPFLKLKTALKTRNINRDLFLKFLNEEIKDNTVSYTTLEDDSINLLALLPCPLKVPIETEFNKFFKKLSENSDIELKYLIDSNSNNHISYNEYVEKFESIDDIPDIVISSGINSFYYKDFFEKFIAKDFFIDISNANINKRLINTKLKDPNNNYSIFAMNLLVIVVDLTKIQNLPFPKKWGDLLKSEYTKNIVIRGHNNTTFCETTLLTIFKQHGYDGVKKLGQAVKDGWHPAQMAKLAGTGKNEAPAITVMPYFYAKTIKNIDKVKIIWPEDGAIVSPVTMLVKKSKFDKLKKFAEFFIDSKVAEICSEAYFPTLNPNVDNKIPENIPLNWIGWDFINKNDLKALINDLNIKFLEGFNE